MNLGLLIGGSVVLLVGTILTIVFTIVGRVQRSQMLASRHMLESEGIVLDAGAVGVTMRLRSFHAPGLYEGRGYRATRRQLVLTQKQLAILGGRPQFLTPRDELRRWQVGVDGDRLHLVSDDPPGAKGHVDLLLSVDDAQTWVTLLREAGCTLIE